MGDIKKQINSYKDYAPEHGNKQYASHLPMAIYALHFIGANSERISDFVQKHIRTRRLIKLSENDLTSTFRINAANWDKHFGTRKHYSDYLKYFERQIREFGIIGALEKHIDTLFSGLCASTFHAMIRTAYGADSNNSSEVARGLAFWADTYLQISGQDSEMSEGGLTLTDCFNQVRLKNPNDKRTEPALVSSNIFTRTLEAANSDLCRNIFSQPLSNKTFVSDFQNAALLMHKSDGTGFTTLHSITSTHAFRVLFNYAQYPQSALTHMARSLIATYASIGAPELDYVEPKTKVLENDIQRHLKYIQGSADEHAIKLAHTSIEEYRNTGRSTYLQFIKDLIPPNAKL